jgi:hypothetical protein
MPWEASRFMMMLASQPTTPPITSQTIRFMVFPPGGLKSVCTRIAFNGSASLRCQCAVAAVYVF